LILSFVEKHGEKSIVKPRLKREDMPISLGLLIRRYPRFKERSLPKITILPTLRKNQIPVNTFLVETLPELNRVPHIR
jgi:hypothetical protein